jgi:hypothetical protein
LYVVGSVILTNFSIEPGTTKSKKVANDTTGENDKLSIATELVV